MKPSKFDLNSSLEESKSLSPLTYYQPFQSSFDPGFGTQKKTEKKWEDRGGPSTSAWRQEVPRTNRGAGILSGPPARRSFPGRVDDPGAFGLPPQAPCGSDPGFGPRLGSTQQHRPPCYPLALNSFSKNPYKSGHHRPMVCNFCKNNKEVPDIYLNHFLYDPETKVLTCPVLRKHVCEICGGTGDEAHTLQYCPVNKERGLQAKVPVLLKTRTITNSTGKIRRN